MTRAAATPRPRRTRVPVALLVPVALVVLAASGYLVLALGSRVLGTAGFAAVSAFYLLANTVGRGTFAALELELTREVAAARAAGEDPAPACRLVLRRGSFLVVAVLVLVGATSPLLIRAVGSLPAVGLLAAAAVSLAASTFLRGPLAGDRRYGAYVTSLVTEGAACTAGAAVLLVARLHGPLVWMSVLAVAPAVGVVSVLATPAARRMAARAATSGDHPMSSVLAGPARLIAGSALFLSAQAVWNLGPVIATARADPSSAAGFTATAILLRTPVMLFPAIQAVLLPRLVASRQAPSAGASWCRPNARLPLLVGAMALWLAAATTLVPAITDLVFGVSAAANIPSALLAVSVVVGTAAQVVQADLLAASQTSAVASAWILGVAVLVLVALMPGPPVTMAATGQGAATVVVLVTVATHRRRITT